MKPVKVNPFHWIKSKAFWGVVCLSHMVWQTEKLFDFLPRAVWMMTIAQVVVALQPFLARYIEGADQARDDAYKKVMDTLMPRLKEIERARLSLEEIVSLRQQLKGLLGQLERARVERQEDNNVCNIYEQVQGTLASLQVRQRACELNLTLVAYEKARRDITPKSYVAATEEELQGFRKCIHAFDHGHLADPGLSEILWGVYYGRSLSRVNKKMTQCSKEVKDLETECKVHEEKLSKLQVAHPDANQMTKRETAEKAKLEKALADSKGRCNQKKQAHKCQQEIYSEVLLLSVTRYRRALQLLPTDDEVAKLDTANQLRFHRLLVRFYKGFAQMTFYMGKQDNADVPGKMAAAKTLLQKAMEHDRAQLALSAGVDEESLIKDDGLSKNIENQLKRYRQERGYELTPFHGATNIAPSTQAPKEVVPENGASQ